MYVTDVENMNKNSERIKKKVERGKTEQLFCYHGDENAFSICGKHIQSDAWHIVKKVKGKDKIKVQVSLIWILKQVKAKGKSKGKVWSESNK